MPALAPGRVALLSFSPTVAITGTIAAVEASDTAAGSGTVVNPSFTGTIAVTEAIDTMVASGAVGAVVGTVQWLDLRLTRRYLDERLSRS